MNYNEIRRKTRAISVGNIKIGGNAPISVQSMTNTPSEDYAATYAQMKALEAAGCDIVRMTVPTIEAAQVLGRLRESDIAMPIVADIHFDYRLAIAAADAGADKIRINPGNIGERDRVKAVVSKCREKRIPIRIGVNSGSLEKELLAKYGAPTAEALAESAMGHIKILESLDFFDIAVSIKSSDVFTMVKANKILASMCDYPLHLGVTEAGRGEAGCLKSALGLGALLTSGIGDTVRVSLTDKPESEIEAARNILKALSLYDGGYINIISCPTCGRTKIDLISLCERLEKLLSGYKPNRKITLAVMGCVVNGPGETREADIGIAGGAGEAVLFRRGEIIRKIKEENILEELEAEIAKLCQNRA